MRFIFLRVKPGCLQLLAMNSPSADRLTVQNNPRRLEGWKRENKMNGRLTCVSGVKEHTQSHGAGTNQGPVVRHGRCSEAVIQGSSVFCDIPVMNGRIAGFTCAVWVHLAPWLKNRTPAL